MKRGGPLERRAQLRTKTPLTARTPLAGGAGPTRRAAPRERRPEPRRRDRDDPGHGLPYREACALVDLRAGGRCERCQEPGSEHHHRQPRRIGPDCPCNLLLLCGSCHRAVHATPSAARDLGLIVTAVDLRRTPAEVPVRRREDWWTLTCDGRVHAHEGPPRHL